jgi:branched-chain amino acid transport system permease protein
VVAQFVANGLIAGSAYAIFALSFSIIYTPCRFLHFAHGAAFLFGAYIFYSVRIYFGLPFSLCFCAALIGTALLGMGMEAFMYRPLRHRGASNTVMLLASIGMYIVLQNIISLMFGDSVRSFRSGMVATGIEIFGARVTSVQLGTFASALACAILVWCWLRFTVMGKMIRAVANEPQLALACGVANERVLLCVFAVGSALAALGGVFLSADVDMTPSFGLSALMSGVVAVIVGGIGRISAALAGGFFVGLVQHLGIWILGSTCQDVITFLILLLFLLARPQGFFGSPVRRTVV